MIANEDPKRAMYLRLLINRSHEGSIEPLFKYLPPNESKLVSSSPAGNLSLLDSMAYPPSYLDRVHYSWIFESIKELSEEEKLCFLSVLSEKKQKEILKLLKTEKPVGNSTGFVKAFLERKLLDKILPKGYVPLPLLPKGDLDSIYTMSKRELCEVISYLGLYDLGAELKKTVDTRFLKEIYGFLSPKKTEFLKTYTLKKEKIQIPRFKLDDWKFDAKDLEMRIHKKGMVRLGKGIANEHESKKWILTHTLDTGRGTMLSGLINDEVNDGIRRVVVTQILDTLSFLKRP